MVDDYDPAKYYREAWMSDDHWFLCCFVARHVGGFHHVTGKFKQAGYGIRVALLNNGFSTVDRNGLTELVFAAHDAAVRVDLCSNGGPYRIGLMLHRRTREGKINQAHPTLEAAVLKWRVFNPAEAPAAPEVP